MEAIFHEKQEGSLCAQHCLNALLQNHYFTAVDLAHIAQQLDERERQHMMEGGIHSHEYQNFLEQPSNNYDDSGFFSIQVLQEAVRVWGLELIPFRSQNPFAQAAQEDPTSQQAYVCNFRQHWFCVRKLGNQWFNLNSLLTGPELISNTYLSLFLTQLQQEGYSLFVVVGTLADTEADQLLRIMPAVQPIKPSLLTSEGQDKVMHGDDDDDQYLQKALEESRQLVEQDDMALQKALNDSMTGYIDESLKQGLFEEMSPPGAHSSSQKTHPTEDKLRQKRLAFLEKQSSSSSSSQAQTSTVTKKDYVLDEDLKATGDEGSDDEMLKQALKMSMEQP